MTKMLKNNDIRNLLKNTNLFSNESTYRNSLKMTEDELLSIYISELKQLEKDDIVVFTTNFIKEYKKELLHQDKIAYRNKIQEIEAKEVPYLTKHLHPIGNFIAELDDKSAIYISTINELNVDYYKSKNELLADIILKKCFRIKNEEKNNSIITPIAPSIKYIFCDELLVYIKDNINLIIDEILNNSNVRQHIQEDECSLFKDYIKNSVDIIFNKNNGKMPSNIKQGDKIQTKYLDTAKVIDIDPFNKVLKLDREIQNEITVFTDKINYENENIITNILPTDSEIDMEMEVE